MVDRAELARQLTAADDPEKALLLERHVQLVDLQLAYELKDLCYEAWSSEPERAQSAAVVLQTIARRTREPEITALADWTAGLAELIDGQMVRAMERLDAAEYGFLRLNKSHAAAATQVSKLYPLAVLGRYDEAQTCGEQARDVFVAHGDTLAAGRIEQNLGNIAFRRDRYGDAELLYRAARARFATAGAEHLLATADNGIANVLAFQHRFREAAGLYQEALTRAEALGQTVTRAEIESNLGSLWLDQGRYDRALDFLERSRRRYETLGMPHKSTIAEQEMADAYLDLNLVPEASAIYARIVPDLARLEMHAERARALAQHGRARLLLRDFESAALLLREASEQYAAEGNLVGQALVMLTEAELAYAQGDYDAAAAAAERAEGPLVNARRWRQALLARWVRGEAARVRGTYNTAGYFLTSALEDADNESVPQVAYRALTSLGLLLDAEGDRTAAERMLALAVEVIETMGGPLPAEEFRAAFIADKLEPYAELVRLCLEDSTANRAADALDYVERARSRALLDMLGGALQFRHQPRDAFEEALVARLDQLREELNWFYSHANRPPEGDNARDDAAEREIQGVIREREAAIQNVTRQLRQRGGEELARVQPADVSALRRNLAADTALVEYFSLHGELLAFVLTDAGVAVVRGLAREEQIEVAVANFRFQAATLRHGAARVRAHLPQLAARARHHLALLYDWLIRPLEALISRRRLVVVPHRSLHYVPFQALFDGTNYLIASREICYAPSAAILSHCLRLPERPIQRALLLGVADKQTPHVGDEISALANLFPETTLLVGDDATCAALKRLGQNMDVVHLACHGNFRPDNPLFSSLHLADGWLTVRDAYSLQFDCMLVTLSACETGVSVVAPGDELLGLARGFFSAGAASLLVSLWAVDDETTAATMIDFYGRLCAGDRPAAALRYAQCQALERHEHPFFWSPFVLHGRW